MKKSLDTRATGERRAARVVPITVSRRAWKIKCLQSKHTEKIRSHKLRQGTDRSTDTEGVKDKRRRIYLLSVM